MEAARWLGDTSSKPRVFNAGLDAIRRRLQGSQGPASASPVRSAEHIEMARFLGSTDAREEMLLAGLGLVGGLTPESLEKFNTLLGSDRAAIACSP